MIKYLEKLLFQKTEGTQSEILYAQWNYDKKILQSTLSAVVNLFPHYSLHDESHSITIINNIVRILGLENIEKLSAIDIWLILEASYSHDIGMVVSGVELSKAISSKDFLDLFRQIKQNPKDSLYDFAAHFKIEDDKIMYNQNELNLDFHDGIKFILAEYFRRKHADRSKSIINDPDNELMLRSPRVLIPNRIFKMLGNICSSHTKNFEDVMNLPLSEVGIDIENAHPRFISCLLRIGDLLDLDNNRFSEVMLRTLGKIPLDSLQHKAKHLSIESFRVDTETIEVKAKCEDYEIAKITQHWFNYLNTEISHQMSNWNKIVPSKEMGFLPTVGALQVELVNYEYIDGKNIPKFSLDTDRALELLQGTGIYEGPYVAIREILQNAVDATLLRIWLEYNENLSLDLPDSLTKDILENYFISIEIKEKEVIGDVKFWEFNITDNGIGFSRNDLTFLMKTGSSQKNIKRSNLIDKIPMWLRPSGNFGIGFQSIFMLTEEVIIETKSFFTEEYEIFTLNGPNTKKDGSILIQKRQSNHKRKPGTKLSFINKINAIPKGYSVTLNNGNAHRIASNFDPFSKESLDVEFGKIFDEVIDFSKKSYIPINLSVNGQNVELNNYSNKFSFYDIESALGLNIDLNHRNGYEASIITYYKNQKAESFLFTKFLNFELNIHKDVASVVLYLSRNKLKPEYNKILRSQFFSASFRVIIKNFYKFYEGDKVKCDKFKDMASMYLNYYYDIDNSLKLFNIGEFNQWEKILIKLVDSEIEMKNLLNIVEEVSLIYDNKNEPRGIDKLILTDEKLKIIINDRINEGKIYFLLHKVHQKLKYFRIVNISGNREILFSNTQGDPIDSATFEIIFNSIKSSRHTARCIIPCLEKYKFLCIKNDSFKEYVDEYNFDENIDIVYPKMLSPYVSVSINIYNSVLEERLNDKIYNWVFENRFDSETTITDIKEAYSNFINDFEDIINNINVS